MKWLAGPLLALSLAGYAGTLPNPVTADRVTTIKSGYGIALAAAVAYRDSCVQRLIPPSCRTVVPQLISANRKVEVVLSRLTSIQKLGPTVDTSDVVNQLSDAVNDLKLLVPGGI